MAYLDEYTISDSTRRIQWLNDMARTQPALFCHSFRVTHGVETRLHIPDVIAVVQDYDDFNSDNDPHGEHNFGAFEIDGEKLFWKIDYYNRDLSAGSEDPSNPVLTRRVLTIMLAEEY